MATEKGKTKYQLIQDIRTGDALDAGEIAAADLADSAITAAKIAAAAVGDGLTGGAGTALSVSGAAGANVGTVADDNTEGGIPVLHRIDITAGANADVDVTLEHKTRVVDAWIVLRGTGVASAVFTVKNAANAISDGIDASGADTTLVRAAQINDANHEIAAAGTLRVTGSGGATMPEATVYVLGVRVA